MKKEKGITMVAVVISVIVLLIISGAVITMLVSDNGLITKAKEAKFTMQVSDFYEEYTSYLLSQYVRTFSGFDKTTLNADNRTTPSDGIIPITKVIPSMKDSYFLDRIQIKNGEWVCSNFTQKEQSIINGIITSEAQGNPQPDNPSDSSHKYEQANVNKPILPMENDMWKNGIINGDIFPIIFDDSGNPMVITDLSKEWYSYEVQTASTRCRWN